MSVIIDEKDVSNFLSYGSSSMEGRQYWGSGIEDRGKEIERWLKGYSKGMSVHVEDTKFRNMIRSQDLKIDDIISEWKNIVFTFRIILLNIFH